MTIALGCTWRPRGELDRLLRQLPVLTSRYAFIFVSLPPEADQFVMEALNTPSVVDAERVPEWRQGRHWALEGALRSYATHVQYADLDRLIRWVETRPAEWEATLGHIEACECLVLGRTRMAYQSHPCAIADTECIPNRVFSDLLGLDLDLAAGSKGLCRESAKYLAEHSRAISALGTDAEWPVLLARAGYQLRSVRVDGLDWESADRYRDAPAGRLDQQAAARAYDAEPANWAYPVRVAQEIVESGMDAWLRDL